MRLIALRLQNYRRFREAEVLFPDGLLGIIGDNGSGKTTIVEAIAFALYGTRALRGRKEGALSASAGPGDVCSVDLRFEFNGQQYEVRREMRGAQQVQKAELVVNGMAVATGADAVTSRIEADLCMGFDPFRISVLARQKEVDGMVQDRPHERRDHVIRLMGLRAIDDAVRGARERGRDGSAAITVLEGLVSALPGKRAELEERERDMEALGPEKARIGRAVDGSRRAREAAEAALERLDGLQAEWNLVARRVTAAQGESKAAAEEGAALEREIGRLSGLEARLPALREAAAEFAEVDARLRALEAAEASARHRMSVERDMVARGSEAAALAQRLDGRPDGRGYADAIRAAEAALTASERALEAEERAERDRVRGIGEAAQSVRQAEVELARLRSKIEGLERLGPRSRCPECDRPLGDHRDVLMKRYHDEAVRAEERWTDVRREGEALERERAEAAARTAGLRESIAKDRAGLERLRQEGKEATRDRAELSRLRGEIDSLGRELASLPRVDLDPSEVKQLRKRRDDLTRRNDELKGVEAQVARRPGVERELSGNGKRRRSAERELASLAAKADGLGYDPKAHDAAKGDARARRDDLSRAERAMAEFEARCGVLENEIGNLRRGVSDLKSREREVAERRREVHLYEKLQDVMGLFRTHMIGRVREDLRVAASSWLALFTEGRYSELEIDEDYEVFVVDGNERHEVDRFSGGEVDVISLSLRMAVSELLANRSGAPIHLVILDEVFGSQDASRRQSILTAMTALTRKFDQVILITHVTDVRDRVEHAVLVEARDDGTSIVTAA